MTWLVRVLRLFKLDTFNDRPRRILYPTPTPFRLKSSWISMKNQITSKRPDLSLDIVVQEVQNKSGMPAHSHDIHLTTDERAEHGTNNGHALHNRCQAKKAMLCRGNGAGAGAGRGSGRAGRSVRLSRGHVSLVNAHRVAGTLSRHRRGLGDEAAHHGVGGSGVHDRVGRCLHYRVGSRSRKNGHRPGSVLGDVVDAMRRGHGIRDSF